MQVVIVSVSFFGVHSPFLPSKNLRFEANLKQLYYLPAEAHKNPNTLLICKMGFYRTCLVGFKKNPKQYGTLNTQRIHGTWETLNEW